MIRQLPLIPTILVVAAAGVMVWLGFWQLGRADEKAALIAQYEAAQNDDNLQYYSSGDPKAPFSFTRRYCRFPSSSRVIAGRNSTGKTGWVHVFECAFPRHLPATREECEAFLTLVKSASETEEQPDVKRATIEFHSDVANECKRRRPDLAMRDDIVFSGEVVLGWSPNPDELDWQGGFVTGTVVPTGEFNYRVVADPPLGGLQPLATPDPNDLPNNHLAYAGQWFFFALTALVIYFFAVRSRLAKRD